MMGRAKHMHMGIQVSREGRQHLLRHQYNTVLGKKQNKTKHMQGRLTHQKTRKTINAEFHRQNVM